MSRLKGHSLYTNDKFKLVIYPIYKCSLFHHLLTNRYFKPFINGIPLLLFLIPL